MNSLSFWQGKRVLVTGHTGFKGSWLCKILEIAGADVTGYALNPPTEPNLFDLSVPKVSSARGDIRDFDALHGIFKKAAPEIVIHMAAQALVLDSYERPRDTFDTNIMGTVNVLECARQFGGIKSILNVTTDKVYFNQERMEGYREEEMLNGYDPYSNSKSCSELVTSSYSKSFFKQKGNAVSTARSGNVIGGGDFSENRLIPDCARAAAKGESVKIRNPMAVRPFQHVLDTLSAYLLIAQAQWENPEVAGAYNIGPEERDCLTSKELVHLFCKAWDGTSWECMKAETNHEAGVLRLDCTKIHQKLNWKPRWNIHKAVEETVVWYQTYFHNGNVDVIMSKQIKDFFQ